MQKNYERNPEQANYIKQKLMKRYPEIFEKYEIKDISEIQVCNLAEFLIKEHPEKYDRTDGTRMDYENDENLKKIFAIIDHQKNRAIMINTNPEGQIEEGEFGEYEFGEENDSKKPQFYLTNEDLKQRIQKQLEESIEKYAKDIYSPQEIKEMTEDMLPKNLDDMEKLATKGDREISEKAERLVKIEKPDQINRKNGKSKAERNELENASKVTIGQENDGQADRNEVPEDVQKACRKLNITHIKSYFYVEAAQLEEKIDGTRVDKNGSKVLMLEVEDSANVGGPNKYYGMQDERMALYGTANSEVRNVTGNVTQMGKVVKPLKLESPEYIEYEDSEGLVIREQIDEKSDLSVQEINRYREEMEDILEKYSQNIYMIKSSNLSPEKKVEEIQKIDDWCDKETTKSAVKYDISKADDKNIDQATDEHTEDMQEIVMEDQEIE